MIILARCLSNFSRCGIILARCASVFARCISIFARCDLNLAQSTASLRMATLAHSDVLPLADQICAHWAMVDAALVALPWAGLFLSIQSRDLFAEIEGFAEEEFGGDLLRKGKLLKIVDELRKKMK